MVTGPDLNPPQKRSIEDSARKYTSNRGLKQVTKHPKIQTSKSDPPSPHMNTWGLELVEASPGLNLRWQSLWLHADLVQKWRKRNKEKVGGQKDVVNSYAEWFEHVDSSHNTLSRKILAVGKLREANLKYFFLFEPLERKHLWNKLTFFISADLL